MEKVRGRANRPTRADSPMADEAEVEKSFWFNRSDGWLINRKTKKIRLEFKRTSDCGEDYFQDMSPGRVADKMHTPILTGLRTLTAERGWEVEVVPLVVGQWSVRETEEWFEVLRTFGIGSREDGKRIIDRLGRTLLNEHEKLFGIYWCHTFGTSSSFVAVAGERHIGPCLPVPPGRLKWRGHRNGSPPRLREEPFWVNFSSLGRFCFHKIPGT
jgi:hypothetical protein